MEYALYKGDKLIAIGTIQEIANELGVQYRTIKYYTTNAYKRKLAKRKNPKNYKELILIDDNDGDMEEIE